MISAQLKLLKKGKNRLWALDCLYAIPRLISFPSRFFLISYLVRFYSYLIRFYSYLIRFYSHLMPANPNHFGAASGDISRNISTGRCDGPLNPDPSKWFESPQIPFLSLLSLPPPPKKTSIPHIPVLLHIPREPLPLPLPPSHKPRP